MKSSTKLHAVCMAFLFCLFGCGGGSSSSTAETLPNTPSSSPELSLQSTLPEQFSSLEINPLADLGLLAGNIVCFSVKSYNNFSESAFSKVICDVIKDDTNLTLSWSKIIGNVTGYYVYFGTDKNNTTNFLADVIES